MANTTLSSLSAEQSVKKNYDMVMVDSGVGGLSVLMALRAMAPHLSLLYLADTKNAPYGEQSPDFIKNRSQSLVGWLLANSGSSPIVVVACNTITVHGIKELRARYVDRLFVGVEPGLKPAALQSKNKKIALLATRATLASDYVKEKIASYQDALTIFPVAGVGLVDAIEKQGVNSPKVKELTEQYIGAVKDVDADVLVLGCTHYSFLKKIIASLAPNLAIIDTSHRVAARAIDLWQQNKAHDKTARTIGDMTIVTTGSVKAMTAAVASIGITLDGELLPVNI